MNRYLIALDQSTSATKGLLISAAGEVIASAGRGHRQYYPQPGWVEHDPEEIYRNVLQVIGELLGTSGGSAGTPIGISITNQRETVVVWDCVTGEAVYNAVVWQCQRGAALCTDLAQSGQGPLIQAKTGLILDPYFSASKIAWVLANVPAAQTLAAAGRLRFGTIDSWLVWKLTKHVVHATDYSNASRTMLFDIEALGWDPALFELLQIPLDMAPTVQSSDTVFGETTVGGLLAEPVPICGVIGDSHAALFGQGCFQPGMVKATYGTGSSIVLNIGRSRKEAPAGIVTSLAWGIDGTVDYIFEGNVHAAGATIAWLVDALELLPDSAASAALASSVDDTDGVFFVPAFVGLGAPYWRSDVRAAIMGLRFSTHKAHIVRAGLESIAYQIADVLAAMQQTAGTAVHELRVDGGPTANAFLMQFQADILGLPIAAAGARELSAVGAAYMGGLGLGIWSQESITGFCSTERVYRPAMSEQERTKRIEGWHAAVACVCHTQPDNS